MNLSAAQVELAARGFDYLTTQRMTIMLNGGKNAFEDAWEWPWLQAMITGPAPLVIPDLKYVQMVKRGTQELLGADLRELAIGDVDLTQTGTPERWYLSDQVGDQVTMRTWPVLAVPEPEPPPNGNGDGGMPTAQAAGGEELTVVYIRHSPELEFPDDVPLIPARHHGLWIDYAVVEAYHDSDNFAGSAALRGEIAVRLQAVIETYETRNRQHSNLITVRGFNEDD